MPVQFNCKNCQKILKTPDGSSGKNCKCPHCGEVMQIPDVQPTQPGFGDLPLSNAGPAHPPGAPHPGSQHPGTQHPGSQHPGSKHPGGGLPQSPPPSPYAIQPNQSTNPFAGPTQKPVHGSHMRPSNLRPHRGGMILGFGISGLVLGLLSCGCCILMLPLGLGLGIPAWVMGQGDLKKIKTGAMDPSGHGMTQAGMICGIIGVVFSCLSVLVTIAGFVIQLAAAGANGMNDPMGF